MRFRNVGGASGASIRNRGNRGAGMSPNFGLYHRFDNQSVSVLFITEMFGPITAGFISVWAGSAWLKKPIKVWTGSAWVAKPLKSWSGSAWVK